MAVRNVKILKGVLYADVDLGARANGERVTLSFKVSATDPEMKEALGPLHSLLERRAKTYLDDVAVSSVVKDKVDEALFKERDWLRRHATSRIKAAVKTLRDTASRSDVGTKTALERTADALEHQLPEELTA